MTVKDSYDLKRMTFGQLLRHFRVQRMLSCRELAQLAGISRAYVTMMEGGQRFPRFGPLRGLCIALALEGEALGVFLDAALSSAPLHMKERPARQPGVDTVLGNSSDEGLRGFANASLPPVGPEEADFLRTVANNAGHGSPSVTEVHACSQEFTGSPKRTRPSPSHAQGKEWRAPITHSSNPQNVSF